MSHVPDNLRRQVIERARGCCEYCLISQEDVFLPHEVDHIIAERHRGPTSAENLCLSCARCNRHKGSDIASMDPQTGQVTPLFNPRTDSWSDHFRLEGATIQPLTPNGRATELLLELNSPDQLERRSALIPLGRYPRS